MVRKLLRVPLAGLYGGTYSAPVKLVLKSLTCGDHFGARPIGFPNIRRHLTRGYAGYIRCIGFRVSNNKLGSTLEVPMMKIGVIWGLC